MDAREECEGKCWIRRPIGSAVESCAHLPFLRAAATGRCSARCSQSAIAPAPRREPWPSSVRCSQPCAHHIRHNLREQNGSCYRFTLILRATSERDTTRKGSKGHDILLPEVTLGCHVSRCEHCCGRSSNTCTCSIVTLNTEICIRPPPVTNVFLPTSAVAQHGILNGNYTDRLAPSHATTASDESSPSLDSQGLTMTRHKHTRTSHSLLPTSLRAPEHFPAAPSTPSGTG